MLDLKDRIVSFIESHRRQLLDMSIRGNTLLHLPSKSKSIFVVDEDADAAFGRLFRDKKPIYFSGVDSEEMDNADDAGGIVKKIRVVEGVDEEKSALVARLLGTMDEILAQKKESMDPRSVVLKTRMDKEKLNSRLSIMHNDAKSYFKDHGVAVVYMAFGFLDWYESSSSTVKRSAPLVLVPVTIKKSPKIGKISIRFEGDDIGINEVLRAKIHRDFDITLPDREPVGEDEPSFSLMSYLSKIECTVRDQARWKVRTDMALGFFSFGRYRMYRDLDPKEWEGLNDHPIFSKLLGDEKFPPLPGAADEKRGFDYLPVETSFVLDADSTQADAIMAARSGNNLVIKGPPGTGKSQTIVNIIAEFIAAGKRVLFVSDKMPALEVVKRRLDNNSLGDAAWELHSHKGNKNKAAKEIARVCQVAPSDYDELVSAKDYSRVRNELNGYAAAINAPILESGVSCVDVYGNFLTSEKKVSQDRKIKWMREAEGRDKVISSRFPDRSSFECMRGFSMWKYKEASKHLSSLASCLYRMDPLVRKSVFMGSTLLDYNEMEVEEVSVFLGDLIDDVSRLNSEMQSIFPGMDASLPALEKIASLTESDLCGKLVDVTRDEWDSLSENLGALIKSGRILSEIRAKRDGQIVSYAWDKDMTEIRTAFAGYGDKWWRFLFGEFRSANMRFKGLMKRPARMAAADVIAVVDDVIDYQAAKKDFSLFEESGKMLFGSHWQGEDSDWNILSRMLPWVVDVRDRVKSGDLPTKVLEWLKSGAPMRDKVATYFKGCSSLSARADQCAKHLGVGFDSGLPWATAPSVSVLLDKIQGWHRDLPHLPEIVRYNVLKRDVCYAGLTPLVKHFEQWESESECELVDLLEWIWWGGLIDSANEQHKCIRMFDGVRHSGLVAEFAKMDKEVIEDAKKRLQDTHLRGIQWCDDEWRIILREANKKRGHISVRDIIQECPTMSKSAKPVFMMSPMSVATHLQRSPCEFDVVLFDEASQVRPEEALGALLRAKQMVVVGDEKQMPPSNFFRAAARNVSDPDEDEDDVDYEREAGVNESLLDLSLGKGVPCKMLRWHYRSRHHSLIAVSNYEFYDNNLVVFPSAGNISGADGLKFIHAPNNLYDIGKSRTNPGEARDIAQSVINHAKNNPHQSLGVVALSGVQRNIILLEIDRARLENPDLEDGFFAKEWQEGEEFFVKSIEDVQGDERDVIFISIGYGRSDTGRISQSFGPINKEGGERRLNVLFSRAKMSMTVFSNMTAGDMDTNRTRSKGARVLKTFLDYAETLKPLSHQSISTGREEDSPFEREVKEAIENMGYEVEPQVGSAGYRIDLCVIDPQEPGRHILAVECDGASYHGSASARDRDRLRQEILEGLGWKFHRIWSTDWLHNHSHEIFRLNAAIASQLQGENSGNKTCRAEKEEYSTDSIFNIDESNN